MIEPDSPEMTEAAAVLFSLLALLVCAFHLALAMGAPWGELTLGGRWKGSLPVHARCLSLASIALLAFFATVMLVRAGLVFAQLQAQVADLSWLVVGYCAVGLVANAASPSRRERALWLPVVICMLALSVVMAKGQRDKLLACGCACFQGYLTGRPMSALDLHRVIEREHGVPA